MNKVHVILLFCLGSVVAGTFGQNIFYNPGDDVRCARLWDHINFEGKNLDCNPNDRKLDLGTFDCKAESVVVKEGCALTVFDKDGCRRRLEKSTSCLWGWNHRITSACCECDGCRGEVAQRDVSCARLFQHGTCSTCSGFRLDVNPQDEIINLHVLNNEISSMFVHPQCQLTVWDGFNFTGNYHTFTGPVDMLQKSWNDQISSLKCRCSV